MSGAEYTPGWTRQVSAFMERRTADTHARVALEHLRPGMDHSVELGWASAAHVRGMARALREWSAIPGGMFAQAWVSATGRVAPG